MFGFLDCLLQDPSIAALRHPMRTRQMTFPAPPGLCLVGSGVAMQDNTGNLRPIRAVLLGVEQSEISHVMHFVVGRDEVKARRSFIINIGIKLGFHTHRKRFLLEFHSRNIQQSLTPVRRNLTVTNVVDIDFGLIGLPLQER